MSQKSRSNRYFNRPENLFIAPLAESMAVKVRRCIVGAGSLNLNPDETDMEDGDDLKNNYHFRSGNFDSLHARMNRLLVNENAPKRVSFEEVNNCKTVLDCVKLVQSKL